MIQENKVTLDDTRSQNGGRGTPDKCLYCTAAIDTPHDSDCVCPQRTVVLEAKIQMVVEVPIFWSEEDILFHRNEGSWCATNLVDELQRGPDCLCDHAEFSFVREANETDEKNWEITNV